MTSLDVQETYRFGRFVLEPDRRCLCADAAVVPLGARAFDILLLLVRNRDRVVSKDEILAAVWRGTVVEENNLAVHISALRRALGEKPGGDRFIATVSGLGYRFVGSVVDAMHNVAVRDVTPVDPSPAPVFDWTPPAAPAGKPRRIGAVWLGMVVVVAILVAIGWVGFGARPIRVAPRLSIAVLPFRSLAGVGQTDYIADAVTDDLTSDLSHIPSSIVIARDSADTFGGREMSATAIGRALNVRYLLEGSLLASARVLHVNARLVDAAAGTELWASVFDVDRSDLAGSLTEIVQRISGALRFTLVQAEETRSLFQPPANPDALDLYLRAKSVLDRSDAFSGLLTAQRLLEKAVEISPDDSNALAELGLVLVSKIGDFDDVDEVADHSRASVVIGKALSQAPQNPLAITANGMLAWLEYRCGEAQPSFHLALSLDPNDLQARSGLAFCARELGHMAEMISELREILRIDPVGSGKAESENSIGMGYLMLGRPREAIDWLNRAGANLGSDQNQAMASGWQEYRHLFLIAATQLSGDTASAVRQYQEFDRRRPHRTVFQLAQHESRAISLLSGNKAFLNALSAAGMPLYPHEDDDFGTPPTDKPQTGDDFDPTPLSIPGGQRVDTRTVHALVSGTAKPLVIDLSDGATVIPDAVWVSPDDLTTDLDQILQKQVGNARVPSDRFIILASCGPFGWQSYNAALSLIHHGFRHVLWYRGGEAAWVAAGYPTRDRRPL